jgi:hypothetical protein
MPWNRKRVLVVLAWLVSLVIANYVGGVVGFTQGYSTALGHFGHQGFVSTTILRMLRAGRTPEAIQFLEIQLDSQIATAVDSGASEAYRSPYNWRRLIVHDARAEADASALSAVLKYREEFPPVSPDAAVNATLMSKLAPYRNVPPPSSTSKKDE